VDPRVLEAMLPYFTEQFGNAASRNHEYGWIAEQAVEIAREQIAGLIGGSPRDLVLTSGATESINLALKGVARAYRSRGDHIVTVATEHKAALDSCKTLEAEGIRVTYLLPQPDGRVSAEQVAAQVDDRTIAVSVMHVNNEIGVVQPIADIAAAVKAVNERCFVHCDAVQGVGKLALSVDDAAIDLLSITAHKIYGPKGSGALWVRRRPRIRLSPLIDGGGHERGMRSGTLAVPNIVGFGKACEVAGSEMAAESPRVAALRDRLLAGIVAGSDGVSVNGSLEHRVPGNLNVSFESVDGEALLLSLAKHVAISSGAACSSASLEPSYVLRAIGVSDELAHASIRFGLGRFNTADEVERVIELVVESVAAVRTHRA
jgi:cysteine desulfurase